MTTTRIPLSVNCELYPGDADWLAGEPHRIEVDYSGLTKPKQVYFCTLIDLIATLKIAVDQGGFPQVAAEAAMDVALQWFNDTFYAPADNAFEDEPIGDAASRRPYGDPRAQGRAPAPCTRWRRWGEGAAGLGVLLLALAASSAVVVFLASRVVALVWGKG